MCRFGPRDHGREHAQGRAGRRSAGFAIVDHPVEEIFIWRRAAIDLDTDPTPFGQNFFRRMFVGTRDNGAAKTRLLS